MNRIQIRISKRQTAISSLMIAILLTVVLSVTVVAAQSVTGSVSGTVKDAAGAAVSGAEVSLVHAQAVLRTTITGADGKFTFDNVAPGTYAINVAHSGFWSAKPF
jgi:protocatechuate 3,4-dioxygenase beta subunit